MSFHFDEASWWAGLDKIRFELEMEAACPELAELSLTPSFLTGHTQRVVPTRGIYDSSSARSTSSEIRDVEVREGLIQRVDEFGRILDTYDDLPEDYWEY